MASRTWRPTERVPKRRLAPCSTPCAQRLRLDTLACQLPPINGRCEVWVAKQISLADSRQANQTSRKDQRARACESARAVPSEIAGPGLARRPVLFGAGPRFTGCRFDTWQQSMECHRGTVNVQCYLHCKPTWIWTNLFPRYWKPWPFKKGRCSHCHACNTGEQHRERMTRRDADDHRPQASTSTMPGYARDARYDRISHDLAEEWARAAGGRWEAHQQATK